MSIHIKAKYVDEEIDLVFGKYPNGTKAIRGYSLNGEPIFTATVAIENAKLNDGCVFLKGWSENEGIPKALESAGIVKLTERKVPTGYVVAIEAKLLV
jgi:hypothetical protein